MEWSFEPLGPYQGFLRKGREKKLLESLESRIQYWGQNPFKLPLRLLLPNSLLKLNHLQTYSVPFKKINVRQIQAMRSSLKAVYPTFS